MKHFREGGIYLAPDGQSLVASKLRQTTADGKRIQHLGSELRCSLFSRYQWALHGIPDFEVAADGNLLALRRQSDWRIDQLIDTGTTAGAH